MTKAQVYAPRLAALRGIAAGYAAEGDDPLPMHPDMLPKRRLHDTIKSLNRNQKTAQIRFMGDGTGEGIRWELATAQLSKPPMSLLG